jgi:hypothetical protein
LFDFWLVRIEWDLFENGVQHLVGVGVHETDRGDDHAVGQRRLEGEEDVFLGDVVESISVRVGCSDS